MVRGIALSLVGLLAALLVGEAILRGLPVSTGYAYQPLNAQNPVLRGTPFWKYVYSEGWNFRLESHGSLNNEGFIATRDYRCTSEGSVLIIGDSYVQAAAVPPELNMHALLSDRLLPVSVFGLGRAGGALPDYLAMAHWGIGKFCPRALVFLIVTGDVEDSLTPKPGGYHFAKAASGYQQARTDRPELSETEKLLNRSKLFRYLYDNLAFTVNFPSRRPAPPTSDTATVAVLEAWRGASDFFLSELAQIFPRDRVLLLIFRGRRSGVFTYDADINVLRDMAIQRGFQVRDLGESFAAYEARTGQRLDFAPVDTHWNARAHRFVADQIAPLLAGMLAQLPESPSQ